MDTYLAALAAFFTVMGAVLIYLAYPHQQWLVNGPWPKRARWWPGSLCLCIALVMLWQIMGSGAAVFTWLVVMMLVWSIMPFLGAWRSKLRERRQTS